MASAANNVDLGALGLRSIGDLQASDKKNDEMGLDTFLELMTTQLKNQDPMKPMENGEFLGQLAQFASVNGLQTLNDNFSALASSLTSNQALQAGSLVDRSVLTQGNYANLSHQSGLSGELNLESSGSDVQVRVYDSVGALVKTLKLGMQPKGELPFKWDGSMDAGGTAPEGTYRIEADYYDGSSRQPLSALVSARVNSVVVQGTGQGLTLNLDGLGSVPFSKVSRIQ